MSLLKKKFGKFAVSSETSRNVRGGHMPLDPWDDGTGGTGGSTGGPRWACSYVVKKGHNAGQQRTQICPDRASADAFARGLGDGFDVACYCLC